MNSPNKTKVTIMYGFTPKKISFYKRFLNNIGNARITDSKEWQDGNLFLIQLVVLHS